MSSHSWKAQRDKNMLLFEWISIKEKKRWTVLMSSWNARYKYFPFEQISNKRTMYSVSISCKACSNLFAKKFLKKQICINSLTSSSLVCTLSFSSLACAPSPRSHPRFAGSRSLPTCESTFTLTQGNARTTVHSAQRVWTLKANSNKCCECSSQRKFTRKNQCQKLCVN